jgi:hypothetical protein
MDTQARDAPSALAKAAPTPAKAPRPASSETSQGAMLHLQRMIGNRAVAGLLASGSRLQRQVDQEEAAKRVTKSEWKDVKARLEADGGAAMDTLHTGQFIRLASLFRKNRDALNLLKSDPLEHLAVSDYETQDNFVAAQLHDEVKGFSGANQTKLIDSAVSTSDLLESLAALSTQSKKHIAVAKHAWHLVVATPATFEASNEAADAPLHEPSWQQVAAVMGATIGQGRQTLYKATFQRIYFVGGQHVAVTFAVVGGKPRVSDAWVVTR